MISSLVITDDIHFVQKLANEIKIKGFDIQLTSFSTAKFETMEILTAFNPQIIFLDKAVEKQYDKDFFAQYQNITIKLDCKNISNLTAPRNIRLFRSYDLDMRRDKIMTELKYIGYKSQYKGTHYLADTILEMYVQQNNMIDNLQSDIYPIVAKKYNESLYNIKSCIYKATDSMYTECDMQRLIKYFHFCYDVKPTVKQVVFAVLNNIA